LTFAAPGWSWNEKAQSEIDKLGITYTSNTRGRYPFFPVYGDKKYKALEIPTTLPTLDEIMGESVKDISELSRYYLNLIHDQGESVLTIHAELEGMVYSEWFSSFMTMLQKEKIQVLSLGEYAAQKLNEAGNISSGKICKKIIEGRAGYVASQKG